MRLVTKKCPSCGASLSFGENDKSVKCEYCKQEIMIEKENNLSDFFNSNDFVLEVAKMQRVHSKIAIVVFAVIIICFFCTFGFIISRGMGSSNRKKTGDYASNKLNNFIEEISQIDDKTLEELKSSGLVVLNEFTAELDGNNTQKWNYVGLYLLKPKDLERNTVYLVYKRTYTVSNKEKEYYSAISYDGLEINPDGNVIFDDFGFPYAPPEFVEKDTVHGYESNKDLYEKVIKKNAKNREISATSEMYMELQK